METMLEEMYQFARSELTRCKASYRKQGTESLWGQCLAYQNVMDMIDARFEKLQTPDS